MGENWYKIWFWFVLREPIESASNSMVSFKNVFSYDIKLILRFTEKLLLTASLQGRFWCFCFKSLTAKTLLTDRSSRLEVFFKKGVVRYFAKFTGKHLCRRLFFFLWILRNFWDHLFYRTVLVASSGLNLCFLTLRLIHLIQWSGYINVMWVCLPNVLIKNS